MKTVAIIQARMGSTRLPGKSMLDLMGKSVLARVIDRVKGADRIDEICVATTDTVKDDVIVVESKKMGVMVYRGSEDDVLSRFCGAGEFMNADYIVRITADNPLTSPRYIDLCVEKILSGRYDYVAMTRVPYGSSVEAVDYNALVKASRSADKAEKEHVTQYVYNNSKEFKVFWLEPPKNECRPDIRVTLDTVEDYERLKSVFKHFKDKPVSEISIEEVIAYIDDINGKGKK